RDYKVTGVQTCAFRSISGQKIFSFVGQALPCHGNRRGRPKITAHPTRTYFGKRRTASAPVRSVRFAKLSVPPCASAICRLRVNRSEARRVGSEWGGRG